MTSTETAALKPCPTSNRLRHGHAVGKTYSPTYQTWQSMIARCKYEERDHENKHVGRGISVCERWYTFDAFLEDMGERPQGKTIDRINNDGNYEPGNCRWATPVEQALNRRNKRLEFSTAVEVALARLRGEDCKSIAARFQISESLPREIVKGRTWIDASELAHSIYERSQKNG